MGVHVLLHVFAYCRERWWECDGGCPLRGVKKYKSHRGFFWRFSCFPVCVGAVFSRFLVVSYAEYSTIMKGSSPAVVFFVVTNRGLKLCVRRAVWYVTSCVVWHATQDGLFSNRGKYWRSGGLEVVQGRRRARERAATRQMYNLGHEKGH